MKRNFFASLCLCILLCPQIPAQNPTVSETRIHSETRIQPSSSTSEQQTATIPEGTVIHLSLKEPLSSKLSEVGDEVIAAVKRDVVVDGQTVLRQGAEVIGRVTVAKPARMPLKGGMLHISFDRIRLEDGLERRLSAVVQSASDFARDEKVTSNGEGTLKGGKSGGDVVKNMGTAAAIGGAVAAVVVLSSANNNSAGFGRFSGAGTTAGAAVMGGSLVAGILFTKGKEVRLDKDAIIRLKLDRPLAVE